QGWRRAIRGRGGGGGRGGGKGGGWGRSLDLTPHVVWTSDPDTGNSFLNRRWFEYTGLSEEESAGGERWAKVLHPDDFERTMRVWSSCMASGQPFEIEYRLRNSEGEDRWFDGRG